MPLVAARITISAANLFSFPHATQDPASVKTFAEYNKKALHTGQQKS